MMLCRSPLFQQMDIFNNNPAEEESGYTRLYRQTKRLLNLEVENIRLLLTEKLTLLLGRIALVAVVFVVCTTALIFLSMSVADFLLRGLAPCWTYLIIGGFYVMIAIAVTCFKRRLIVDPIARYISRVILDPPAHTDNKMPSPDTNKPTRTQE